MYKAYECTNIEQIYDFYEMGYYSCVHPGQTVTTSKLLSTWLEFSREKKIILKTRVKILKVNYKPIAINHQ